MIRIWRRVQWPVMASLALAAFGLGFVGFRDFYGTLGEPRSFWDLLYLTLQLFVLESGSVWGPVPWTLQVARLLAPAVAGYAAVGALAVLFREQAERFRLRFFRNHIVICALGRKGLLLARSLREKGRRVVIIEEDSENDLIETARKHGAIVLVGDARDPYILRSAGIARAAQLVAVSGDDGVNAEVAVRARPLVSRKRPTPLSCLVHIVDPELCNLLRVQEIARRSQEAFRLDFFNVFEGGARALLKEHPVMGVGVAEDAHAVVVGLGRFGESLILQAAREWRRERGFADVRLPVTVADKEASSLAESLSVRYPWLGQVCDLKAVDALVESREFTEGRFLDGGVGRPKASSVYVCLDDDSQGISAALTLYRQVRDRKVPVVVRTVHGAGLASLLREGAQIDAEFVDLHPFGLLDRMCDPELLFAGANEVLARAIHDEYIRDRAEKGETRDTNPAMRPWEELAERQKESNRAQAAHIGEKLTAVHCDLGPLVRWEAESFTFAAEELERLARMEHERWVQERVRTGWTPGPRDEKRKTSPYLVPWRELPEEARERDRLFVRELPRLLAKAGLEISRRPLTPRTASPATP